MTSKQFDVLVIGSCMTDLMCYSVRLPKPGETIYANKFVTGFGGKGANQCVAAAKLGASCALLAKLGNDSFGESYLNHLKQFRNINIQHLGISDGAHSGIAQITVGENGENSIVIAKGANDLVNYADVDDAEFIISQSKIVLFQNEIPLDVVLHALKLCRKYYCITVLNAAPAVAFISPELISLPYIFCVNEVEAEVVTGLPVQSVQDASAAILKLRSLGSVFPIITLGSLGAVFMDPRNNAPTYIAADTVENVVDTTGAGDFFVGVLAFLLAKNPSMSAEQLVSHSVKAASLTVQKAGTQTSYPDKDDPRILDIFKTIPYNT